MPHHAETTLAIVRDIFGPPASRPFAVRLWDGTVEGTREDIYDQVNQPLAFRQTV